MDVSIPDSLSGCVAQRVRDGGYPDADAFVADLLRNEAGALERQARGEPLVVDERFDRRLEALLDDAAVSGDYLETTRTEFDRMERDALAIIETKRPNN